MQIDRMELYLVRLPLAKPFRIANELVDACETVYFRMGSGGVSGWGEVTPGNRSYLTSAWSQGVFHVVKNQLTPILTQNRSIESGERLKEILAPIKGNRHAKAVVDLAWNDLNAKLKGRPLWKTLGGVKRPIDVGLTFDRDDDVSHFLQEIHRGIDDGFRRITLKIRPGWDVQTVNFVRSETPPLQEIQVDIEGGLEMEKHSDILYRMEDFFLTLIEQPLSQYDYVGHTMLAENFRTPIALDESIKTIEQAAIAIDLRSAETFCIKPGRVGGLTEARLIHQATIPAEISCYGGFDLQSSVGYRHLAAAASLPNFQLPCDYLRFSEVFPEEPGVPLETSIVSESDEPSSEETPLKPKKTKKPARAIELWDEPGIGCDVDLDVIEKFALDRVVWEK